ncbi:ABC transporter permease [Clostridium sp.]|uniref:ABC transporter permease n=1 Tax=Clostridium sp. TaxID=1506 RepID=UPI0025BF81AE|nr:ABC transporter permease [Clostridium sp.]
MKKLSKVANKVLLKLFLLFQLTISLIFLMQYISMTFKQHELESKTNNILGTKNIINIQIMPEPLRKKTIDEESISNFYNALYTDNDIKISSFNTGEINISNDSEKISSDSINSYNSDLYNPVLFVDENYSSIYNFKISEGTILDFNDIDKNIIPVLVGSYYKENYKLNDLIKSDDKNYKIVGFLEPEQYIIGDYQTLFLNHLFLDNYIIIPKVFEDYDELVFRTQYISNCFIKYSNSSDTERIKLKIEEYASKYNIECTVSSYYDKKEIYLSSLGIPRPYEMSIYITIIICSILGISIMLILNIVYRKKEIGIKLSIGYSKLKIFYSILRESGIIIIISYIITLIYYKLFTIEEIFQVDVNLKNSITLFIICIVLLAGTNMIPARILMKSEPKDLIGGLR